MARLAASTRWWKRSPSKMSALELRAENEICALTCVLNDDVIHVVDDIAIVVGTAAERVGSGAAIQHVFVVVARDDVVQGRS